MSDKVSNMPITRFADPRNMQDPIIIDHDNGCIKWNYTLSINIKTDRLPAKTDLSDFRAYVEKSLWEHMGGWAMGGKFRYWLWRITGK
jgi:hypothetical protein